MAEGLLDVGDVGAVLEGVRRHRGAKRVGPASARIDADDGMDVEVFDRRDDDPVSRPQPGVPSENGKNRTLRRVGDSLPQHRHSSAAVEAPGRRPS